MRLHRLLGLATSSVALLAARAGAQQSQLDVHANYARTTRTHQSSWGAGANIQVTWGSKQQPLQLNTSLGPDYEKQENGGPRQVGVSFDAVLQPGGSGALTPYAGGSVSANWLSGAGAPSGAKLGLEYIVGAQLKLERQGSLALKAEVRPGYVRTQEHSVTGRFGVVVAL